MFKVSIGTSVSFHNGFVAQKHFKYCTNSFIHFCNSWTLFHFLLFKCCSKYFFTFITVSSFKAGRTNADIGLHLVYTGGPIQAWIWFTLVRICNRTATSAEKLNILTVDVINQNNMKQFYCSITYDATLSCLDCRFLFIIEMCHWFSFQ